MEKDGEQAEGESSRRAAEEQQKKGRQKNKPSWAGPKPIIIDAQTTTQGA
jgi:hypothetical protein